MKTHLPGATRVIGLAGLFPLMALSVADRAWSQAADAAVRYQVVVRQVEGHESVPAHLSCRENEVCDGTMSISTPGGQMRVFVIAMIDGGNAWLRFHAEERDLSCGRPRDFVSFPLGRPPVTVKGYAYLCDAPPSHDAASDDLRAEPPVLKDISPPLATLRIDLRSIESGH